VQQRLAADEAEWRAIADRTQRKQARRAREQGAPRHQSDVEANYTRFWSRDLAELWAPKIVPFEWGSEGLLMHSIARRRLNHLLLARALSATGARQVLEVGAGTAFHPFLLAVQDPNLDLTAVELTEGGIETARGVRRSSTLPDIIASFAAGPIVDRQAHRRVGLVRASAERLPFADGAFDAVCTVLALEQMEAIRARALSEIRRVSRRWVIMIEPFRDLNSDGSRSDYVRARDYFGETIEGLSHHGLTPRAVYRDIPNKLTLHVALVVAERC
jgi:SAM-dependent methyltransferase